MSKALRRMWRAVGPGGLLAAEDGDFLAEFCEPPHPRFDFWQHAYQETLRRHGGDPLSGRRLHPRFREVGVPDPQLEMVQHVYLTGEGKLMPYLTVARSAPRIIASGVATQAEGDEALILLAELAADTTSAVSSPGSSSAGHASRRPQDQRSATCSEMTLAWSRPARAAAGRRE